ncbi:hypothetical protein RND71_026161 [Anisodus tanguticus]|uniref:Uncharacterized protein n=1 Tax=Anisodus tanguticus TaxID=243964 RepID=A0AAE1RMY4_9SOLA|nr:hypothetical protein RND71_026161 [Anisodus tanguticus]
MQGFRDWKPFENILDEAKSLANGYGICVDVWNVTEENDSNKYEGGSCVMTTILYSA